MKLEAVVMVVLVLLVPGSPADGLQETALSSTCATQQTDRRLYVSTVDGALTALDTQGHTLWSYHLHDPLFSSTLSYVEVSESVPQLIPGLDRALYHWNGIHLQRLPVMAEDLIDHNLPYGQGSSLVGSKVREVVAINLQSGKPVYKCSQFKCHRYDNQSVIRRMDILKVTTNKVMVREADDVTGEEMWNFTVGEVQLGMVEGEEEEGGDFSCWAEQPEWVVQVDMAGGRVYAVNSDGEGDILWEVKLAAPVTGTWLHNGGRLERVPVVSTLDAQPMVMMVSYKHQFYIQSLEGRLPRASWTDLRVAQPKSYRPVLPPNQEPEKFDLALYHSSDSFLHLCTPGPSGLAVYFSLDHALWSGFEDYSEENDSCQDATCSPLPQQQQLLTEKVAGLLVGVVKYLLFGLFVLGLNRLHRYLRSRGRGQTVRLLSEDEEYPRLEQLTREDEERGKEGTEGVIPSSSEGNMGEHRDSQDSRFETDYELRGRLGRGGFGVVYHVINKTDGSEYAVKRIKLPTNKSAREKVMREVKALAQLEHPGIVRYFHSWVEKAPNGWIEREEWAPLSRRESYTCTDQSLLPSTSLSPPLHQEISPCPSFNSLNHITIHSVLPPPIGPDSRSSSFIIEFNEEHSRQEEEGGCFRRQLLIDRDDLSTDSNDSYSDDFSRQDVVQPAEPPTYLFIQMQLCRKDSLREWLKSTHNRERSTIMHFFEQTLDAVLYVHCKGMMHRDLKPSNIFFSLDGRVKVGDFGLVTGTSFPSLQNSYLALESLGKDPSHTSNIGSHFYMSPEQMLGALYDQKVDIFSLGVIFFELNYIFTTEMERAKVLEDLRHQKFPQRFRTQLPLEADFVEWLMTPHCKRRPSAEEVHRSKRFTKLRKTQSFTILPRL